MHSYQGAHKHMWQLFSFSDRFYSLTKQFSKEDQLKKSNSNYDKFHRRLNEAELGHAILTVSTLSRLEEHNFIYNSFVSMLLTNSH